MHDLSWVGETKGVSCGSCWLRSENSISQGFHPLRLGKKIVDCVRTFHPPERGCENTFGHKESERKVYSIGIVYGTIIGLRQ